MPTRISEYRISIKKGEILISADSFAPYKLGLAGDVAIRGRTFVHGDAACVKLRGGSLGCPIVLQSGDVDLNTAGGRYVFISPIAGRIKAIHIVPSGSEAAKSILISFYNWNGVEASTVFTTVSFSDHNKQSATFDWFDPNDAAFCSVGVGTSFWAYITASTFAIMGPTSTICAEIVPIVKGGIYV